MSPKLVAICLFAAAVWAAEDPAPSVKFGITVAIPEGLRGTIYAIPPGTEELPNLCDKSRVHWRQTQTS